MTAAVQFPLRALVDSAAQASRCRDLRTRAAVSAVIARLTANAVAAEADVLPSMTRASRDDAGCIMWPVARRIADPAAAAAANAAAITASQCDDGLREARGHPGLHAYAAALAVSERQNGTMHDFRSAFHLGWEVGARLGLLLGPTRAGIHPHGGWGAAASAAAAAHALGLARRGVERAVATALMLAMTGPDSTALDGTAAHYLLPATGTSLGVYSAFHVAAGGEAPSNSLGHFAKVAHQATTPFTAEALTRRPLIHDAYLKPAGFCAHTLTSWTVATKLRPSVSSRIERIDVTTYAAAAQLANRTPGTALARRFSIPWAVACALTGQEPTQGHEETAALAAVTSVTHAPVLDRDYPASRPARVTIHLRGDAVLEGFARFHPGDRENPLPAWAQHGINARLVGEERPALAIALQELDTIADRVPVRDVTDAWASHTAPTRWEPASA